MGEAAGPYLRPAEDDDADALHVLFGVPAVYRYLADGAPPPREVTNDWLAASRTDFSQFGVGLWVLCDPDVQGCLRLEANPDPRSVEITWVLHPDRQGRGLATAMARSAIGRAFGSGHFDRVIAGADVPNAGSIAVMRRLGMRHLRDVTYPAGPGVEYVLERGALPDEAGQPSVPIREPSS